MEPKTVDYLKAAITEPEEDLLSEEELEDLNNVVNTNPEDYDDEEEYEEEYEDDLSCIGTGDWEDFVYCKDTFHSFEHAMQTHWTQTVDTTQKITYNYLQELKQTLLEIRESSEHYQV